MAASISTPFRELTRRRRRRLIVTTVVRTTLTVALLLLLYSVAPTEPIMTGEAYRSLFVALAIIVAVVAFQVHAITHATYPEVRAIEAVISALTLFVVLFALFYASLAAADVANFSQPLSRVGAFYFTVTVLSTVGFGDIAPRSDLARLAVSTQMLLDLALIAIIVRVFTSAARSGARRAPQPQPDAEFDTRQQPD